jgi:hypothetical protein
VAITCQLATPEKHFASLDQHIPALTERGASLFLFSQFFVVHEAFFQAGKLYPVASFLSFSNRLS